MTERSEGIGSTALLAVVVAGGRDYRMTAADEAWLDTLPIREVVSGGATGADAGGESWARKRGIPVKRFPADWNAHGRAAGPIRNRQMAEYADAVALLPGGRGTDSMRREAERRGLQIFSANTLLCHTRPEDSKAGEP